MFLFASLPAFGAVPADAGGHGSRCPPTSADTWVDGYVGGWQTCANAGKPRAVATVGGLFANVCHYFGMFAMSLGWQTCANAGKTRAHRAETAHATYFCQHLDMFATVFHRTHTSQTPRPPGRPPIWPPDHPAPTTRPRLVYQPRSARRCGAGRSATLMPTMASPSPRETSAILAGWS